MKKQILKLFFLYVLLGLFCSGVWGQRSNTLSGDRIHVQFDQQATSVKFDSSDDIQIIKSQIPGNLKNIQNIKLPYVDYHTVRSKEDYYNTSMSPSGYNSPEEFNQGLEEPKNKLDVKKPGVMAVEEAGSYTVNNFIDSPIPDMSGILLTYSAPGDIPADAAITGIEYCIRILPDEAYSTFYCADYEIFIKPAPISYDWLCVYDNLGGINDENNDDDEDNDADIWLNWRSTDEFNGEPVQNLVIYIADNISVSGYEGYGKVSYAHVRVYWTTPPETPTLISPANGSECLSTSSFVLDWSDVSGAVAYELQLDENPDFSSPDAGLKLESEATAIGAPPNTTFYWRVRALNEAGSSSYSTVRSFTTGPPPPEAVNLDNPPDGADCEFTDLSLYWSEASDAAAYQLMVDDNSDFSSPHYNENGLTSKNQMLSGLSDGTTYYWRVRGENTCGTYGSWSSTRSFTTAITPAIPTLSAPADFATCQSTNISFSWSSVSGAESYHLIVDNNNDFSSPHFDEDGLTSTSQSVSGLSVGTTYYWRVRGENICGHRGSWSITRVFATSGAAPGEVTPSSPTDAATCQALNPTIIWSAGSGASNYVVQVDDNSDFSSPVLDDDGIAETSQVLSGLSEGTTYYWRVKSVNSCDLESDWSSTMSFTTGSSEINAPILTSPADLSTDQPLDHILVWSVVSDATTYQVQLDDEDNFSSPLFDEEVSGTSLTVTGLESGTAYFWQTRAIGTCSTSEWSEMWQFETSSTSSTSIAGISKTGYSLEQNYPNPFMESTTIEFNVPKEGQVKLEFMDLQGKMINVFTGYYSAGNHSMKIHLSEKVLSGVYLYRMKTEGFIDTRLCVVR